MTMSDVTHISSNSHPPARKDWRTYSSHEAPTIGVDDLSEREQMRLARQLGHEADVRKNLQFGWENYIDYGEEPGFVMTRHDYIILGELVKRLNAGGSIDTAELVTELVTFLYLRDKTFPVQEFRDACGQSLVKCTVCGVSLPSNAYTSSRLHHDVKICRGCTEGRDHD